LVFPLQPRKSTETPVRVLYNNNNNNNNAIKSTDYCIFGALLVHHQGVQYVYKTVACYIGLLHVSEMLNLVRSRMCIADRIVHSMLDQLVN